MTDKRLLVLTGTLGEPSETFIRRHVCDLHPGHTVCIARRRYHGMSGWSADVPTLVLDEIAPLGRLGGPGAMAKSFGLLRPRRLLSPQHRSAIAELIERERVGAALGEFLDATLPFVALLQEAEIPLVAHGHGSDVSLRLRRSWWRRAYGMYATAERVVTVSHVAKNRLVDMTAIPESKISVIPCGPPIRAGRGAAEGDELRCIAVGRLVAKKDPLGTLSAFLSAESHVGRPMRLTIVGDGPLATTLRVAVERAGAASRVELLGALPHDQVEALLAHSDLFLQHSRRDAATGNEEGLPVAILEAMSYGLPVVSTRHGGIPEAIDDGVTGFLVNEGDYDAMASRIVELARDRELRRAMGEHAMSRLARDFSWERERERLLELLEPYLA
jgi:glycosyltransferase involved in cell wall biosynthesis